MTVTLNLKPEVEAGLEAHAHASAACRCRNTCFRSWRKQPLRRTLSGIAVSPAELPRPARRRLFKRETLRSGRRRCNGGGGCPRIYQRNVRGPFGGWVQV